MRTFTRIALLGLTVPMLAALPSTAAFAAPTNAPYSFPGTADCGPDGTFDFVVNTGPGTPPSRAPVMAGLRCSSPPASTRRSPRPSALRPSRFRSTRRQVRSAVKSRPPRSRALRSPAPRRAGWSGQADQRRDSGQHPHIGRSVRCRPSCDRQAPRPVAHQLADMCRGSVVGSHADGWVLERPSGRWRCGQPRSEHGAISGMRSPVTAP